MKRVIIAAGLFLSAFSVVSAQSVVKSIVNQQTELIVNDSLYIKKGGNIMIYLPAGHDFVFVRPKKAGFNAKLLGKVADVAGTGAAAIGVGSGSLSVLRGASRVMNTANAVQYGAGAIDKIQSLPISNNAKKIAGREMVVIDWLFTDEGYVVNAMFDKKKYEIYLQEAIMAGEIQL